jgi:hypothetical protein
VRRIEEGTWLGHVAEHVAIELQNLAGADVVRGKTRSILACPASIISCSSIRTRRLACWPAVMRWSLSMRFFQQSLKRLPALSRSQPRRCSPLIYHPPFGSVARCSRN